MLPSDCGSSNSDHAVIEYGEQVSQCSQFLAPTFLLADLSPPPDVNPADGDVHIPEAEDSHDEQPDDDSRLSTEDTRFEDIFTSSDASDSGSSASEGPGVSYESDLLDDDLTTLDEMLEDLQAQIGPDQDEEFWKLRKCFLAPATRCLISFPFPQAMTSSLRKIATISALLILS